MTKKDTNSIKVFSHAIADVIDPKELDAVSGGGGRGGACNNYTVVCDPGGGCGTVCDD